jgi:IMP dehydrogenase
MKLYNKETQLCFDDILLVPQSSDVASRKDINLTMSIGHDQRKIELYLPIIAAPMDTVCESAMALEIASHGGLGIIHRYMDEVDQKHETFSVAKKGYPVGVAVGSSCNNTSSLKQVESLVFSGAKVILVDTANGHNIFAVETVREIRRAFPDLHIMAGNVSTWDGFLALSLAGADSIRVGIGGGSCCTTRLVTGHGLPTLASIMDIYQMQERLELPTSIVADGGIRNSGDMVKAFAAGADAVMLGSLLSGHQQSPGKVITVGNKKYKRLRGMASREAQFGWRKDVSVVEGTSLDVEFRGDVSATLDEIRGEISSGCSYSGVHKLEDLQFASEYAVVSSLSVNESRPHAIKG